MGLCLSYGINGQGKVGVSDTSPPLTSEVHFSGDVTDAELHGHLTGWQGAAVPMCKVVGRAGHKAMSDHDTTMHSKFSFHPLALRQTYDKYLLPESVWCYNLTKISTFREQRIQPCVLCPKRSGREDVYTLTKNQIEFARSQELAELCPWQHEIVTWFHRAKMGLCSHNPNIYSYVCELMPSPTDLYPKLSPNHGF